MPDTVDALVQDLSAKDRAVRRAATEALVALGAAGIDQLLPYALDKHPMNLGREVQSIIERWGDEVLPRLRGIRRTGPGRLRRKALEILVDLGGQEALNDADRRAVERLVRIKILDERPVKVPFEAGRWLAFPADRFDDAVSALELYDVRPATTVMGVAAATQATDCLDVQDSRTATRRAYRVFITPAFENEYAEGDIKRWRMLWGNSFLDELDGFELARELSGRCGEAHFYVLDPYNGSESWYVARDGHTRRAYSTYAYPQFEGEPLPFEAWYTENADEDEAEAYSEGVPDASTAAQNLSVEPGPQLAEDTYDHGWLATTDPAVPNSRFKGALPI
ncbi:hypothetical protein ACFYNL_38680 [Streptomyces sp. NPDC007808]|uniref:hypothetical protein n=1 Tax=Streptomyces sp. NPDC007808 TaxID=3364779 RepID=UPI00369A8C5D